MSEVERESWTEFLGGNGVRPLPLPVRAPVKYEDLDGIIVDTVHGKIGEAREVSWIMPLSFLANSNGCLLPVTGTWCGESTGGGHIAFKAIWLKQREIGVYFRGELPSYVSSTYLSCTYGGREIKSLTTKAQAPNGKRVAVFTNVDRPAEDQRIQMRLL